MSHFAQLLASNGLTRHDGRTLWRYGISEDFFRSLQMCLQSTRFYSVDPRDCALYYAAWWKCNYNGNIPSKQMVFESIASNRTFDEHLFYETAKKGAALLGIPWIKHQNTLPFRTLLLQGGLPLRHVSNNEGDYTRFMIKIMKMNPASIDDFAFDTSITGILPQSSQNKDVYASCLEIVKAVLLGDNSYLADFLEDKTISRISATLIKERPLASLTSKTRLKTIWLLEKERNQIRLHLSIPSDIRKGEFNKVLLQRDVDETIQYEYNLFYENKIICKFILNACGDIKTDWIDNGDLEWRGYSNLTELYLLDPDGKRYDCSHIISYVPHLTKPSLWSKASETQWVLEKGRHTPQQEAILLVPDGFQVNQPEANLQSITIRETKLHWLPFNGEIEVTKDTESYRFKSKSRKIEWFVADEKPNWMLTANMLVVRHKPTVHVYDEEGQLIHKVSKSWRQKGRYSWQNWDIQMEPGLIEILIEAEGIAEIDEIFKIGSLELEPASNSLHEAEVNICNTNFLLTLSENPLVSIAQVNQKKVQLTRTDTAVLPKSIHASVKLSTQRRELLFEINPPFKGFEIIDNDEKVVPTGTKFRLKALGGYRLLTNEEDLVVNLYNSKRPKIVLSEKPSKMSLPLKHFEEWITQLYSLSDAMDGDAEVVMEIGIENNYSFQKIKEYRICRYDQYILWEADTDGYVILQTQPNLPDLFAVPIDCPINLLGLYDLVQAGGLYQFRNKPEWNKYIVFGSKDSNENIQPTLISLNSETKPDDESRKIRTIRYHEALLNGNPNDDSWQQLFTYYIYCRDNNLSFATFDILRACSFSPILVARVFLYLICNDYSNSFLDQFYRKLEVDLGFFFHWVAYKHWLSAIDWVDCISNDSSMEKRSRSLRTIFSNQHPVSCFDSLFRFIVSGGEKFPAVTGFPVNQKIAQMRSVLGLKVQRGIPKNAPPIPEEYQHILRVTPSNEIVKLLITAPVAVALSIAGKNDELWQEEHQYMRRNVRYSYRLYPEWYGEAVVYSLSQL